MQTACSLHSIGLLLFRRGKHEVFRHSRWGDLASGFAPENEDGEGHGRCVACCAE